MRTIALIVATALAFVGCAVSDESDCEDARTTIVNAELAICASPGYGDSKFCMRCVDAQYYSTTGASVCQCAHLTFDTNACSYATGNEAMAQVRSAIDWADSVCPDFTPPVAIPPMPEAGPPSQSEAGEGGGGSTPAEAGPDGAGD